VDDKPCGNPHETRRVKLLAEFGKAKPGTTLEVEICLKCGVRVKSREIGYDDSGWRTIPSGLIEPVE
jgi:hypothetical protein